MASRTVLAAVSVACLMSTAIATTAAAQEVAAPTIISLETLKWNPTPFPDVTVAVIAGNPTASGMYVFIRISGRDRVAHDHEGTPVDQPGGKFLGGVWGHVVLLGCGPWGRPPTEAALPDAQFCDCQSRKLRRVMDTSLHDLDDLLRDHFR